MWISLYTVQTLVGAVLWRKYTKGNKDINGFICFLFGAIMIPNIILLIAGVYHLVNNLIDFLAGVKK